MKIHDHVLDVDASTLSLRGGETFYLTQEIAASWRSYEGAVYERLYMVALVKTPPFPAGTKVHDNTDNRAVIAAATYVTGDSLDQLKVGWIHLTYETKQMIGKALELYGAKPDQWFYLVLDTRQNNLGELKVARDEKV